MALQDLVEAGEILYLNSREVEALGVFDFPKNVAAVRDAYLAHHAGQTVMPKSDYLKYAGRPSYDRIIPLLGFLGGATGVSGIKVVGSSTANLSKNRARASAVIVLHDPDTQRPFCIMEGAQVSAARTATVTALSLELLSPPEIKKVALIGCGYLARTHLIMWSQCFSHHDCILHAYDLDGARTAELGSFAASLGLAFQSTTSAEEAIRGADVVIPLTTQETPYIRAEWIKSPSLYSAVSLLDPELDVLVEAEHIVVDDLEGCLHEGRPLLRLQEQGRLDLTKVHSIGEVLQERPTLRKSGEERIFFNPMGTVITDLAVANQLFLQAESTRVGTRLPV